MKELILDCKYNIPLAKPINQQAEDSITFKEGGMFQAFSGDNPSSLHGPRALWGYVDEFARAKYQKEIMDAADFFFSEGGQLSLISTLYGKNNKFWEILQKYKEYGYYRLDIYIFKNIDEFDISKPLQEQLHLGLESPWLDLDRFEKLRLRDPDEFRQQMCGDPVDEIMQFFPDELTHGPPVLNPNLKEVDYPEQADIWIGALDEGAVVNKTVRVAGKVVFKDGKVKLVVPNIKIVTGDYNHQKTEIIADIKMFKYKYFSPDETSMGGINWVSDLRRAAVNTPIKGISYGGNDWVPEGTKGNNKQQMFEISKLLMQDGIVEICDSAILLDQLSKVEKKVMSDRGEQRSQYSGKQGGKFDDDVVCAFCQLCLLFYRFYIKNQPLKTEIKGMQVYPRVSISGRGAKYSRQMRFL